MKQINEDYCSYEAAKLLKEKKFDVPVKNYFSLNKDAMLHNLDKKYGAKKNWNAFKICISRPSQSLALKWLREVHTIFIDIMTYTTGNKIQFRWVGYDKGRLFSQEEGRTIYFESYEQAVEAALKFTLENLI